MREWINAWVSPWILLWEDRLLTYEQIVWYTDNAVEENIRQFRRTFGISVPKELRYPGWENPYGYAQLLVPLVVFQVEVFLMRRSVLFMWWHGGRLGQLVAVLEDTRELGGFRVPQTRLDVLLVQFWLHVYTNLLGWGRIVGAESELADGSESFDEECDTQQFDSWAEGLRVRARSAYQVVYAGISHLLVCAVVGGGLFCPLAYLFHVTWARQCAVWLVLGAIFFWLFSGFTYFIKRYRYGKFTSGVQRFWKRANIYFWLVEACLFILFVYYYLNSSQEPQFLFDHAVYQKDFLLSLPVVYFALLTTAASCVVCFILLLSSHSASFPQLTAGLLICSVQMYTLFFAESYQFYYLLSSFDEVDWVFDDSEQTWELEFEIFPRRVKRQYFELILIAKYWHFVFIFFSWLFFLGRSLELKHLNLVVLGFLEQNLLLITALNLVCVVEWVKWLSRRFYDVAYFWFFVSPDGEICYSLAREVELVCAGLAGV